MAETEGTRKGDQGTSGTGLLARMFGSASREAAGWLAERTLEFAVDDDLQRSVGSTAWVYACDMPDGALVILRAARDGGESTLQIFDAGAETKDVEVSVRGQGTRMEIGGLGFWNAVGVETALAKFAARLVGLALRADGRPLVVLPSAS